MMAKINLNQSVITKLEILRLAFPRLPQITFKHLQKSCSNVPVIEEKANFRVASLSIKARPGVQPFI